MDKPDPRNTPSFLLPGHHVLAVGGRDALAFTQAQFMNDIGRLADGQWQWNGWLTPKGRLIALFALLRVDAETLWLLLTDADADAFAQRLQRFVFRSKLAIDVRGDLQVSGALAAPDTASGAQAAIIGDRQVELDLGGEGGPRTLRIAADDTPLDPDAAAHWMRHDLAHGFPRLLPTQDEQWTPQQLSLDRLHAYSVKKGCYPGQEIVARTHFLGQAKRGLALLASTDAMTPGAEVHEGDDAIGRVVSAAGDLALAVLPLGREFASLSVDGIPAQQRPLQDGLAR